ncbi:MAG: tRNA (adenosine(37)-N6)-threonylcarbamoyltransferase complex dimerization subunit type 1 TsaB [Candidatus Heteroscillospira sp.]|jgi:tRNA threonylcarbamoyladenosine biosynthesis protein TsaB
MLTLAFESSAKSASAALVRDGVLLGQSYQNSGLTHSRTLLPMAEDMLKNLDIKFSDIDLLAVSRGPGSFTGIRIGVATVKGLAWALEKPVCGVSTLEAMANLAISAGEGTLVCCAMDARRNQVYNALFEIADGKPRRLTEDRPISIEELISEITSNDWEPYLVGDGAALCKARFDAAGISCRLAPEPVRYQNAWGVAASANMEDTVSGGELAPVYLRLSQAERERLERLNRK